MVSILFLFSGIKADTMTVCRRREERSINMSDIAAKTVDMVKLQEDAVSSAQLRKIQKHPCFSENACHLFGAVAPKCNILCNYCIGKFDCVNESRPGVTSKVLSQKEALERVQEVIQKVHYIKVGAVAGPGGEPLFSDDTFETFRLVTDEYPNVMRCLSTNGLLLPERIDEIIEELGIGTLTVTLNAIDPEIGKDIYSFVGYRGKRCGGKKERRYC